ncbi:hypothetical protein RRG08_043528 [Elysia crispata]|uniref:Uncharacterized protein n=1 Tax=Elysia crispata TaxID=231223 RepID=A0AAE0YG64_9GAST|nr:hypothetical protein RRG08_043528 [Elysia crispata]
MRSPAGAEAMASLSIRFRWKQTPPEAGNLFWYASFKISREAEETRHTSSGLGISQSPWRGLEELDPLGRYRSLLNNVIINLFAVTSSHRCGREDFLMVPYHPDHYEQPLQARILKTPYFRLLANSHTHTPREIQTLSIDFATTLTGCILLYLLTYTRLQFGQRCLNTMAYFTFGLSLSCPTAIVQFLFGLPPSYPIAIVQFLFGLQPSYPIAIVQFFVWIATELPCYGYLVLFGSPQSDPTMMSDSLDYHRVIRY